ncbi:hypothetical protein [Synechococcus sp. Cu2B8-bc1011]|uniref:hypothetical protein n=1 Tax=Synechococcus sp. Cu2B8-bc1011 TaxID=3093725 RepID=UPI0039B0A3EE
MASALAAVGRLSVAALSVSAHSSARASIEAAINDNIQTMQKEDSYFTREWIEDNTNIDFKTACKSPAGTLNDHLQSVDPEPRLKEITRTFDANTTPGILKIAYSFQGPEQNIGEELRVIEMNPNFASQCYTTL